jgi:hypothetical protein
MTALGIILGALLLAARDEVRFARLPQVEKDRIDWKW